MVAISRLIGGPEFSGRGRWMISRSCVNFPVILDKLLVLRVLKRMKVQMKR